MFAEIIIEITKMLFLRPVPVFCFSSDVPGAGLNVPLEFFDVAVDPVQFTGDFDALGTMLKTLAAADAVVRLTQGRNGLVIARKVFFA